MDSEDSIGGGSPKFRGKIEELEILVWPKLSSIVKNNRNKLVIRTIDWRYHNGILVMK